MRVVIISTTACACRLCRSLSTREPVTVTRVLTAYGLLCTIGEPVPTDPIQPISSVPLEGMWFYPAPGFGIWTQDHPSPLTAKFDTFKQD